MSLRKDVNVSIPTSSSNVDCLSTYCQTVLYVISSSFSSVGNNFFSLLFVSVISGSLVTSSSFSSFSLGIIFLLNCSCASSTACFLSVASVDVYSPNDNCCKENMISIAKIENITILFHVVFNFLQILILDGIKGINNL